MPSSSASRGLRRNKPEPPAPPSPEAVERARDPVAVPRLPTPAAFARKPLDAAPAAAAAAAVAGCAADTAVAPAPRLPAPAAFARKPLDATPAAAAAAAGRAGDTAAPAAPALWLPPPAAFARKPPRPGAADPGALPEPPARPQVPPPASFASTSRRRRDEAGGARDWAALPRAAVSAVLRRLGHVEVLMGAAGRVCRSWRRAARDDPALWRRIDMRGHAHLHRRVDLCGMAREAIRRTKGQCEAFWAEYAADDGVLRFLGDQAPSLKSLRLISCQHIIKFEEEIKKFPLLEELEISLFTSIGGKHMFEAVGQACLELKHLRFNRYRFVNLVNREHSDDDDDDNYEFNNNMDDDALGIASMHGLRSLQLFGNNITNEGLIAILDNCPHLESLDIRHCFNIIMDDTLRAKCARIKMLKLPYDPTEDYCFPVCSPLWLSGIDSDSDDCAWSYGTDSDSDDYVYGGYDYILDSDEYDDYCDPFRYLNGVYEDELGPEDRMFLKGMRMLMRYDDDDDSDDFY